MRLRMQSKIIHYCQCDNDLSLHPESTKLCNAINYVLPMNEMQMLMIEKMFYSPNNISNSNCD